MLFADDFVGVSGSKEGLIPDGCHTICDNIYSCARTAVTDAVTIITIAYGQLSHML